MGTVVGTDAWKASGGRREGLSISKPPTKVAGSGADAASGIAETPAGPAPPTVAVGTVGPTGACEVGGARKEGLSVARPRKKVAGSGASASGGMAKTRAGLALTAVAPGTVVATNACEARGGRRGGLSVAKPAEGAAGSGASASGGMAKTRAGLALTAVAPGTVVATNACEAREGRRGGLSVAKPAEGAAGSGTCAGVAKLGARRVPSLIATFSADGIATEVSSDNVPRVASGEEAGEGESPLQIDR